VARERPRSGHYARLHCRADRRRLSWSRYRASHVRAGALQFGGTARTGFGQWLGEFIATFGLIGTILGCVRFRPDALPPAVGLYITSAYWFTSSTSFANPAVTIARALSATFAGITPRDVPGFLVAELLGALAAACLFRWLF
jgi:glycerol uptake facilitator-like aquaporin